MIIIFIIGWGMTKLVIIVIVYETFFEHSTIYSKNLEYVTRFDPLTKLQFFRFLVDEIGSTLNHDKR